MNLESASSLGLVLLSQVLRCLYQVRGVTVRVGLLQRLSALMTLFSLYKEDI